MAFWLYKNKEDFNEGIPLIIKIPIVIIFCGY